MWTGREDEQENNEKAKDHKETSCDHREADKGTGSGKTSRVLRSTKGRNIDIPKPQTRS